MDFEEEKATGKDLREREAAQEALEKLGVQKAKLATKAVKEVQLTQAEQKKAKALHEREHEIRATQKLLEQNALDDELLDEYIRHEIEETESRGLNVKPMKIEYGKMVKGRPKLFKPESSLQKSRTS